MKQTLPQEVLDLFKQVGTALNQYTEDPAILGEPWRSKLLEIKGRLDASLETLPPTDQIPAAQEARFGLDILKNQLLCVQNIINSLGSVIKAKSQETANALASISGEVEKGIEAKVKAGELLRKSDVEGMVSKAREDGEKAGFAKGKALVDRRNALALAGLPAEIVAQAPDAVLILEDEKAFESQRDAAKDRLTKLQGVGLAAASATVQALAWAPQADFDKQFASLEEVFKASKGQSNNAAPKDGEKKEEKTINPFLTGSNGGAAKVIPLVIV